MADESLEDFKKRTGAVGGSDAASGDGESLVDFKKRTGAVAKPPAGPSLADIITSPDAVAADRPAGEAPPSQSDIVNALQPAPNTTYGDLPWVWGARDDKTGALRFAMPNALREPLLDIFRGTVGAETTMDPESGRIQYGMTPGANALQSLGVRGLQFSGASPLQFVPPGALEKPPLPPDTAANLLSPDARARAAETSAGPATPTGIEPPAPAPVPAAAAPITEHTPWVSSTTADIQRVLQENTEAGGPTSLGAMATPEQLAKMTPAQVKANRRVAELNQIVTPIEGEDSTEWVHGSSPTEAERMGHPVTSQKETLLRFKNPDAFEGPSGQLTINDRARVKAFDETLLSDTQAADLKERQQAEASKAQGRILSTAKPVDLKPAADWIEAKLADPLIQEDRHVFNSLKGLRDQLYDADGNLKTDPRAAWGMHNNLRNKLLDAKDPFSANPSEKYAVTQVNEFKGMVDGALDKASDGQFRTHLDTQAEFLKSLNAWRLLNDFRYGPNKMINAKSGMINGNAFHRFVTDLGIRRGRPGIDAAMDIPDNVMQRLININQDLKRAGRIDLGKPRGSPTNLFFELAGALGITGAHALTAAVTAGTPFGGIANIGVQTGISAMQRRLGQRRINLLTDQALQPPPGGLTPPPGNPLQPP